MAPTPSLVTLFVAPLEAAGIDYMVTGGLASIVYGHPRLTLDVDLVIRLEARAGATFGALWAPDQFYVPPPETIAAEQGRSEHGHFNVIHHDTAMRADIYLAGDNEFSAWGLARCITRTIEGVSVRIAPIEYVIVNKLRYFAMGRSDRHLRDIARMIEISGSDIDRPALEGWITRLGLEKEWRQAREYREPA